MNPYLIFIILCYLSIAIFWIITGFNTKKVKQKSGGWTLRIIAIIIISLFIYAQNNIQLFKINIFPNNNILKIVADIITVIGVYVMIWSRITLGKNWSANIVIKEDHKLIITGPYSFVRHPIYSGLILIVLGTSLYINGILFFIFTIIFFFGAYYKGYKEEKILINHFGDEYLIYKKKVKALIPFLF